MQTGLRTYEVVDSRGDRHVVEADSFEAFEDKSIVTVRFYQDPLGVILIQKNMVGYFVNPIAVNRLKDISETLLECPAPPVSK